MPIFPTIILLYLFHRVSGDIKNLFFHSIQPASFSIGWALVI